MKPHPISPRPNQESVWDYPRPPALQSVGRRVLIAAGDVVIADTKGAYRVLETSHPPVYYLPPSDIDFARVEPAGGGSHCEWKGRAKYFDVVVDGQRFSQIAWAYPAPTPRFDAIAGYLAFYAGRGLECSVGGEVVEPQPGGFYGGWITSDVVGPFKGGPGSWGW